MPKIILTTRKGETINIDAENNISLLQNIQNSGNDEIMALCGGARSCATCHVYVSGEWFDRLDPASSAESELVEFAEGAQTNSRLSCQIQMIESLNGICIEIAPED